MLRPFLLRLRDPVELDRLRERLLEVLRPGSQQEDDSLKIHLTSWEGEITSDVRVKFRVGLSTNLFGSDDLLSLRMKLSLADISWVFLFFSIFAGWRLLTFSLSFLQKLTSNEKQQMECGLIAQDLLKTISHRVLRTIIRHLVSVVKTLTCKSLFSRYRNTFLILIVNEIPFVSRTVVQSLLPGSPPDLTEEGRNLSDLVQHLVRTGPLTEEFDIASQLNEICPACGIRVPLQDITMAVCDNGHSWGMSCSDRS